MQRIERALSGGSLFSLESLIFASRMEMFMGY